MSNRRIGITLGDCAGIGPEIVELALKSGRVPDSAEYVVIGRQPNCQPGQPTPDTARAAAAALEEAVTLARRSELNAIVMHSAFKNTVMVRPCGSNDMVLGRLRRNGLKQFLEFPFGIFERWYYR